MRRADRDMRGSGIILGICLNIVERPWQVFGMVRHRVTIVNGVITFPFGMDRILTAGIPCDRIVHGYESRYFHGMPRVF